MHSAQYATQLAYPAQAANWTRYQPGQRAGHYESFFQRANHPTVAHLERI